MTDYAKPTSSGGPPDGLMKPSPGGPMKPTGGPFGGPICCAVKSSQWPESRWPKREKECNDETCF
jgi:hypothetical protein